MEYYTRELLEGKIKKDIPNEIRDVILDVLEYLCIEGFTINRYIDKVNNTEFFLTSNDNFEYRFILRGNEKIINIPRKNIGGFYNSIVDYDSELNKFYIAKEIVLVRVSEGEKNIKGKILHEVLHLISAKNNLYKVKGKSYHFTGLCKCGYSYKEDKIISSFEKNENFLNEAVTEVLRYGLMKEIYNEPYKIPQKIKDGKKLCSLNGYYLMTNMMQIINVGIYNTTEVSNLLKLYLTNNIAKFNELVSQHFGFSDVFLKNIFGILFEAMNTIYGDDMNAYKIQKYVLEDIYPLYEVTLMSMYKIFQIRFYKQENLKNVSQYLDMLEDYIEISFSYPIVNIMQEKILKIISSYRYIYYN